MLLFTEIKIWGFLLFWFLTWKSPLLSESSVATLFIFICSSLSRTPWFTLSACVVPTPWYPSQFCDFVFVSSVTKCVSHNVLRSGSLWDLSVPVFLISHFIFDPYEVTVVIFFVSSTYYLTAACWIGLLSAPLTYSARACTCWSVPAPLFASTDLASNRLALLPAVCATFSWTGSGAGPQSPFIWSAVSRNSSQLEVPFSGFPYSFSFFLAFCFFDYFGQDHFVPELELPFHPEGTHFLFPFGNIWVLEAEGVRLCFSDLKSTLSFLLPLLSSFLPPSLSLLLPFA